MGVESASVPESRRVFGNSDRIGSNLKNQNSKRLEQAMEMKEYGKGGKP